MAFVTDSNRPQPLWQPPPTACLTAPVAASEVKIRNRRKCTRFCRGILRTKAIFPGVIFSALGMHPPLVPVQFTPQGPYGRPVRGYCGLPLAVVHDGWSTGFQEKSAAHDGKPPGSPPAKPAGSIRTHRERAVRCARAVRKVGCSPPPGVR